MVAFEWCDVGFLSFFWGGRELLKFEPTKSLVHQAWVKSLAVPLFARGGAAAGGAHTAQRGLVAAKANSLFAPRTLAKVVANWNLRLWKGAVNFRRIGSAWGLWTFICIMLHLKQENWTPKFQHPNQCKSGSLTCPRYQPSTTSKAPGIFVTITLGE